MLNIYSKYLSDEEIEKCCLDENFIRKMLDVEIALAIAQAELEVIPQEAALEIQKSLTGFQPESKLLVNGTLENGIPTIPLLAWARQQLSTESKDYLHWGATSQDIMDTAQILMIREVLTVLKSRILTIIANLQKLSQQYQNTIAVARTRTQQAVPITYGQKIENWWQPLERHLERLEQLMPRLLVVQFGGAGGNLSALGARGIAHAKLLAEKLDLNYSGVWHNQRDSLVEFANWLSLVAGTLGKMAQDILLLSQTEVGEVIENSEGGGKSSTMPHKNNPILSEAIVALAKYVVQLGGINTQTLIHQYERDGASWALEWLTLPQMMIATGTILKHALVISEKMKIKEEAVKANVEKLNGLIFSEKASFVLTKYMARKEAKKIVGEACTLVLVQNIHLADALDQLLPQLDIDWKPVLGGRKLDS